MVDVIETWLAGLFLNLIPRNMQANTAEIMIGPKLRFELVQGLCVCGQFCMTHNPVRIASPDAALTATD